MSRYLLFTLMFALAQSAFSGTQLCEVPVVNTYTLESVNRYSLVNMPAGEHQFLIRTKDIYGLISQVSSLLSAVPVDHPEFTLVWSPPTEREDETPLPLNEIAGYEITHILPTTIQVQCDDASLPADLELILEGYRSRWSRSELNEMAQRRNDPGEDDPESEPREPEPEPDHTDAALSAFVLDQANSLQAAAQTKSTNNKAVTSIPATAPVVTTADVVSATTGSAACFRWSVRGVCIWMTCATAACSFDYSLKVKNFVPDLLVQSYDQGNGEPWAESKGINSAVQGNADSSWVTTIISAIESFNVSSIGIQGGVTTEVKRDHHANLNYKFVDAYGNPALAAFDAMASSAGLFCEGATTMMVPYFISNLDAIAWRWDVPEMFYPQSWMPLITKWDLGSAVNNYGPIYPRHGFMTAQDPLKAAVLSAFRAAHVVTREYEPHVYLSIYESSSPGYWPPKPLDKNEENTGVWQMLYPDREVTCHQFPYGANPLMMKRSTNGSYVWNFWRAYECCEQEGQILIFHTVSPGGN